MCHFPLLKYYYVTRIHHYNVCTGLTHRHIRTLPLRHKKSPSEAQWTEH
nr:MAG TPA: hypothetical protein [Caudoviricetes sp.]